MATINVSNSAELYRALSTAKAGDTIELESGTYSGVQIRGIKIDGDLMITSKDPGQPAILTDLDVRDSSGLNFSKLEFSIEYARGSDPMKVMNSKDIHFDGIKVHGSADGISTNDTSAMQVRNSTNISIENSEFHDLANAVTHLDSNGVVFSGNYFHDIRMDAIRGGGTSNLTVEKNYFTNFRPEAGDHGDAIQVWNSNTTTAAQNILIRENVIVQGDGGAVQGIFVTAQISKLIYQNVKVADNIIVGGLTNAITVAGAEGVIIDSNVVAAVGSKTWIRMTDVTKVTLTGNASTDYYKAGVFAAVDESNNTKVPAQGDGGLSLLKQWLANGHNELPSILHGLMPPAGVPGPELGGEAAVVVPPVVVQPPSVEVPGADAGVEPVVGQVLADGVRDLVLGRTGDLDATGNALSNKIVGNAYSNHLLGGAGNDTLDGGAYGNDVLEGGSGDDTYIVGPSATIIEQADGGIDTVQSMYFVTLSANVENLEIIGRGGASGTGNNLDNKITGNAGNNVLSGEGGNDTIDGGAGKDVLIGGAGNDVLTGGEGGDYFEFRPGSGHDIITDFGGGGDREGINFMYYVKAGASVTATDVEQGALIRFDADNSVLLTGVHAADLQNTGTAFFIN
jgi:Ca2+-binding RTX toxin-like protein